MRPKRHFSFGCLKYSEPSCYIQYENLDVTNKCPTLIKILDCGEAKLSDLPKLQIETEKISSILGYRMMHLKSLIDGNPMKAENGLVNNVNKSSQFLQFISLPNEDNEKSVLENHALKAKEQLIVKSDPDKPLTLIISQHRPATRQTAQNLNNNKRKLIVDVSEPKSKRLKSLPVNIKADTDTKQSYEIPNKFWELMEPYCAEINEEHIGTLESYIGGYENDGKYYQVPERFTSKDDRVQENRSTKIGSQRRHTLPIRAENSLNGFVTNKGSVELSNLLKKIDNEIRKPLSQTKTLKNFPQHLVTKLCQETDDMIALHKSQIREPNNGLSSEASCLSKSLAKQLKVSNSYKLERHIKKSMDDLGLCNFNVPFVPKLEPQFNLCQESGGEQGIAKSSEADIIDPIILGSGPEFVTLHLPGGGDGSGNKKKKNKTMDYGGGGSCGGGAGSCGGGKEDNKALLGLQRRQAELKLVSESNLGMLRRLLVVAKRDMKRQAIERRLAVADADVIDSYNVIESYRPAHKAPLKKDRDAAYRAIKDRQKLLKELEAFDSEFF